MRRVIDKRGQVWVETVIYTLIGLAIIGLVLAAALPKINAKKDEVVIEQSIEAMSNIDDKIYEVQRAAGNRRAIDLEIRKGVLVINMTNNTISWILDSSFEYSEVDTEIPLGRMSVTTRIGNPWEIELKMGYSVDIRYGNTTSGTKQLDPAPIPYKIMVENLGEEGGNVVIDLSEA